MAQLAPKALSDQLVPLVAMEQSDPRVLPVLPVTMAQSDPRVLPVLSDPPVTMVQSSLKVQQALKVRFPMVLKLAKCTIGMGMLGFIYLLV